MIKDLLPRYSLKVAMLIFLAVPFLWYFVVEFLTPLLLESGFYIIVWFGPPFALLCIYFVVISVYHAIYCPQIPILLWYYYHIQFLFVIFIVCILIISSYALYIQYTPPIHELKFRNAPPNVIKMVRLIQSGFPRANAGRRFWGKR